MTSPKKPTGSYRKIDVFVRGTKANPFGRYVASTKSARNLREAREMVSAGSCYTPSDLCAEYVPER